MCGGMAVVLYSSAPQGTLPAPTWLLLYLLLVAVAPIQAESALRGHPAGQRGPWRVEPSVRAWLRGQRGAQGMEGHTPAGGGLGLEGEGGAP